MKENPLQHSRVFNFKPGASIYGRVETLMNSEKGLVGLAWSALREAWFSNDAESLIIVRYESLTKDPAYVIEAIYRELDQKTFLHDFKNIEFATTSYDVDLGLPGLHKIRPSVTQNSRPISIPPDIVARHSEFSFWNKLKCPKHILLL